MVLILSLLSAVSWLFDEHPTVNKLRITNAGHK